MISGICPPTPIAITPGRTRKSTVGMLLVACVCAIACKPAEDPPVDDPRLILAEGYAEKICSVAYGCGGCARFPGIADEAECYMRVRSLMLGMASSGGLTGIEPDLECAERHYAMLDSLGCTPLPDAPDEATLCAAEATCQLFHGAQTVGGDCNPVTFEGEYGQVVLPIPFGSDCAAGLLCVDGTCISECPTEGFQVEGGDCSPAAGDTRCGSGLYCDDGPEGTFTCLPPPALGEPCLTNGTCDPGYSRCHPTGTCAVLPEAGQSCTTAIGCQTGSLCIDAVCEGVLAEMPIACDRMPYDDAFEALD